MGGVEGELYKEQRSGHLLTWGPKSGARQRALWILSLEHWSSSTALGVRLGSGLTHVLGCHGNSGRDREEGTIIQLLQPQVPGREQGEGSDDQLLAQGHLACQGGRLWRARFLTVWSPTLIYIICFRLFWFSKWVWCWVLWLYNSSGIEVRIKVFLVNGSRICWFGRKGLSLWF